MEEFMSLALTHPEYGYYARRRPIGRSGDFVTAPEISQMFGELIGLWMAEIWRRAGRPRPMGLVELGPGRGTLTADLLRTAERVEEFGQILRPMLVETGNSLRSEQRVRLRRHPVCWFDFLSEVPEGPAFYIANEFFDAMPIRQFVRKEGNWRERKVTSDASGSLAFVTEGPASFPSPELESALRKAGEGAVAEYSAVAEEIVEQLGRRVRSCGGAALLIDYGYEEHELAAAGGGDTLQAVRRHNPADVLQAPGQCDLSAHVNFTALARAAERGGARVYPVVTQGAFLERLGIGSRAEGLARGRPSAVRDSIAADRERLAGERGMGRLFRVLAFAGPDWPRPEGFEPETCGRMQQ